MRLLVLITLTILLATCGAPEDQGNMPAPNARKFTENTENNTFNTNTGARNGIDADFAGRVTLDDDGSCQISVGNDSQLVECALFSNTQLERVFEVDYTAMNFERAPVCTTSLVTKGEFVHNLSLLDRQRLRIRITAAASTPVNPPQPAVVVPLPFSPRPDGPVCTPAYQGPRCISCCGSSYGIDRISRTVRYTPDWPREALFNCKITD